jgi:hypothetical protein
MNEFNRRVALRITSLVSSMWCAYLFAAIALISLPAAIRTGDTLIIVAWVAQTFLQLVLLSIIMVGQGIASEAVDKKISETHEAVLVELAEVKVMAAEIHTILKDVESKK